MLNLNYTPLKNYNTVRKLTCLSTVLLALIITGCRSSPGVDELPRVVSAISTSNTEVLVQFSEEVQGGEEGAENPYHYSIVSETQQSHIPVLTATFSNRHKSTVILTTASQSNVVYKLTVSNIRDKSGIPISEPTLLVDPSSTTFVGTSPSSDTIVDTDGDGLSDHFELSGWVVYIKRTDGESQMRTVTSDPGKQDTDNDGVLDAQELNGGMDPRNADTDGDTLTDNDEWNTIFSDPTSQDSDHDGIQDGVEYNGFRTSPILADTDGDQMLDPDEMFSGNRNPLLADLPSPRVTVGNVDLQLDTVFTFTNEAGETVSENKTVETSLSRGSNDTSSTSNENSTKNTLEFSQELEAQFSVGLGSFKGVEFTGKSTTTQGSERGSIFTAGQETSRSSEEAYHDSLATSTARDIRESVTREIVGATVKAFLSIDNIGDIPFTISNLELTAQSQDPNNRRRIIPVASLVPENDFLGSVNIGALGDPSRGPFVFKTVSVFPQQVQELMKNPRGLVVQLANFDITDEQDRNFAFTSREVLDRTAGISFDLGDGRVETYRVATASSHDPVTGRPLGITMARALNIIGLHRYETIRDGGDGIVDTTVVGDDEQIVLPGRQVEPGEVIIGVGNNGYIESVVQGDDVLVPADYETVLQQDFDSIRDGGNRIVDTTAVSDDVQNVAVGSPVSAGQVIITAGPNQVLDTIPAEDDRIVTAVAAHRVLTRFRDIELDADSKRFWVLFASRDRLTVDLDNYVIRSGEQFNFVYVQDKDDDGVWAHEESLHGSSDLLSNTDGCTGLIENRVAGANCDYLDDKQEIQEGWLVQLKGSPQANKVYPNPNQGDSDRDQLFDDQEKACQLDPRQRDTDLDGLTDWEELYGKLLEGGDSEGNMVSRDPITNQIVYPITPYYGSNGDLVPHDAISDCSLALDIEGFATDPLNADTDGDLVNDAQELRLGLNPNDSSDGPLYLDDDGDGVPNKIEEEGFEAIVNGVTRTFTSNPNDPDTDDDGLPDLLEHFIHSNPSELDTDDDGISDTNEYKVAGAACITQTQDSLCIGFNDLLQNNFQSFVVACENADVCNNAEIENYLGNISAENYGTNLNERDSDFDGLDDLDEMIGVTIIVNGVSVDVTSKPLDVNSDTDQLTDNEERNLGTDPRDEDTDGDTTTDHAEANMTSPKRSPSQADRRVTIQYSSIVFVGSDCDFSANEEWVWNFGYQNTVAMINNGTSNNLWSSSYYGDTDNGSQPIVINHNPAQVAKFVLNFGSEFTLKGSLIEYDGNTAKDVVNFTDKQTISASLPVSTTYKKVGNVCGGTQTITAVWSID